MNRMRRSQAFDTRQQNKEDGGRTNQKESDRNQEKGGGGGRVERGEGALIKGDCQRQSRVI